MFPIVMPTFAQSILASILLVGATKLFLVLTLGVCKSTKKLKGKTVIITGANTGIGKETALDLAQRGARIILACRNMKKASEAQRDIIEKSGNKDVAVMELDLSSLGSVRKFAAEVIQNEPRLDILINNAGCASIKKEFTKDGLENQMQTNHFGHFLLTNLLVGLMVETRKKSEDDVRIINVSSEAHKLCRNSKFTDDLNFERDPYAGTYWKFFGIYGASKMCNILFTIELAKKLESYGITVNSLHPGAVFTEFARFSSMVDIVMRIGVFFVKTAKEGAQTTIYLAVDDEVSGVTGQYFKDCKVSKASKLASDVGVAKKLWELSESFVKLKPEEKFSY